MKPILGSGYHPSHLCDVAFHSAQPLEFRTGHVRDDLRQRGLPSPGRAGQDYGRQPIGLNCASQKFSRREDMFLPDKFLESARTHASSERCRGVDAYRLLLVAFKEIMHKQSRRRYAFALLVGQLCVSLVASRHQR